MRAVACRKVGISARRIASRSRELPVSYALARRPSPAGDRGGAQGFALDASRIPQRRTGFNSAVPSRQSAVHVSSPCGRRCRPEASVPADARVSSGSAVRVSRPDAPRCRSEDRRSQPSALPFKWWRRRESNPRPKAFCNDVYMHIRVVVGNPRPEAPFPLSVPHRINPANRGSEPIPCAHRRLGKTASKAHLSRRPFPPGRRGQEERGYLSSQCQFSVGFCFVSTVYERWTPDMQSLLHMPSSNPVRPPSSRD